MTTHKDMPPKVDPEEEKDLELLRSNEAKNEARLQEMVTLGASKEEVAEMRGEIDAVKLTTPEADNRTIEQKVDDARLAFAIEEKRNIIRTRRIILKINQSINKKTKIL